MSDYFTNLIQPEDDTEQVIGLIAKLTELAATDVIGARQKAVKLLESCDKETRADPKVRSLFIARGKYQLIKAAEYDAMVKVVEAKPKRKAPEFKPSILVECASDGSEPYIHTVENNSRPTVENAKTTPIVDVEEIANGDTVWLLETFDAPGFAKRYATGVIEYAEGLASKSAKGSTLTNNIRQAKRVTIARGYTKGESYVPARVIFDGSFVISSRPQVYTTSPSGTLMRPDWSDTVTVEAHHENGDTRFYRAPAMALKDHTTKATWIDPLGLAYSECSKDIASIIRMKAIKCPTGQMIVTGMGPVLNEDGQWMWLGQEGSYTPDPDKEGELIRLPVVNDLSHVPADLRYHGVTPPDKLSHDEVKKGMKLWEKAIRSAPGEPAIAVAPAGNVIAAPMGTIDAEYWSVVYQSGIKGSGKTYSDKMFDAVQSPTVRKVDDGTPRPFVNMGQIATTSKGGPIRLNVTRGYSVSGDDVLKHGDSDTTKRDKEKAVREIIRSYEGGGGAQGGIDRANNSVISRNSGELQSNMRFTSELPLAGASTIERMIVPPHINDSFNDGPLDKTVRKSLLTAESLQGMHIAWSAMAWYQFANQTRMRKLLDKAQDITRTWGASARLAKRYASVLYGILVMVDYCDVHGISIGDVEEYAIAHLQSSCARQGVNEVLNPVDTITSLIRAALINTDLVFPGAPIYHDGEVFEPSSDPFRIPNSFDRTEIEQGAEDGIDVVNPEWLPHGRTSLGMRFSSGSWIATDKGHGGYFLPPASRGTPKFEYRIVVSASQLKTLTIAINRQAKLEGMTVQFTEKEVRKYLLENEKLAIVGQFGRPPDKTSIALS
jgi:hypothetical protein